MNDRASRRAQAAEIIAKLKDTVAARQRFLAALDGACAARLIGIDPSPTATAVLANPRLTERLYARAVGKADGADPLQGVILANPAVLAESVALATLLWELAWRGPVLTREDIKALALQHGEERLSLAWDHVPEAPRPAPELADDVPVEAHRQGRASLAAALAERLPSAAAWFSDPVEREGGRDGVAIGRLALALLTPEALRGRIDEEARAA